MRVLILGGNGFIGQNLSDCLVKKGHQVKSFDLVLPQKINKKVQYIQGDFFDCEELEKNISIVDVVVHAVSTINPGNSNDVYMRAYKKDFIQSIYVAQICSKYKCRLVYLSSGGTVYGNQNELPINENSPTSPINHYGNIKLCIENTYRTMRRQQNSDICIARIANPYGPGQDYEKGVGFIDAVLKRALKGEKIYIYGDGLTERDYIYIEDVCELVSSLILKEYVGEVYNIGTGVGTTQKRIIEIVNKFVPEIQVQYEGGRNVDVKKIVLDNKKIIQLTDYKLIDIEEGIYKYYLYLINKEVGTRSP